MNGFLSKIILSFLLLSQLTCTNQPILPDIHLETIYGNFSISEPILIELIQHPMMQRLKRVRQYGVNYFVIKPEEYHRYEHSIGVFLLLRKFGAGLHEQIAGLLHDVSHTVFSHVGDWIFKHRDGKASYQDTIHELFIENSGLGEILGKHGIDTRDIHHKQDNAFTMLEQDLPDLCADRIEYNLQGGLREGLITPQEFDEILQDLKYENGNWYFNNPIIAEKFADISLFHTKYVWGSSKDLIVYFLAGKVLKRAIESEYVTSDDIHYGTDDDMWKRLNKASDKKMMRLLTKIKNYETYYSPASELEDSTITLPSKFRGVDPLIKVDGTLQRLTHLSHNYKQRYDAIKKEKEAGYRYKKLKVSKSV